MRVVGLRIILVGKLEMVKLLDFGTTNGGDNNQSLCEKFPRILSN